MKHKILTVFFLWITIALPGCGVGSRPHQIPSDSTTQFVNTSRIVNAQRLKEGGNLLIVPFKAGVGVEASEKVDKTALRIIRGIVTELNVNNQADRLNVLTADQTQTADLMIRGYITQHTSPSRFKKFLPFKKEKILAVEAWMMDVKNEETIVYFTDQIKSTKEREDDSVLAEQIGQRLAEFIVSGF